MSYLGLQLLYNILNKEENIACERVFSPAPDMEALMRQADMPLFTLETKTPLNELDILGFTLQYEMSYTNILNILNLGKIPMLCADRGENDPLIVAGGPCAYNPEPLADFIDVFLIGDGEDQLPQFANLWGECRREGLDRKATFSKKRQRQSTAYMFRPFMMFPTTRTELSEHILQTMRAPQRESGGQ